MKTITLILLFLALNTAVVLAKDYKLVARAVYDSPATNSSTVYVLLLPDDNPVVFQTFDSKAMESVIRQCVPSGSVLYIIIDRQMKGPTEAQGQALRDYCKKIGIIEGRYISE